MSPYAESATNGELCQPDVKVVETQYPNEPYAWLEAVRGHYVISGIMLFTLAGVLQSYDRHSSSATCTSPDMTSVETQSIAPSHMVLLPSRFGAFYEEFERDEALVDYYRHAAFFDDRDLQG